MSKEKESKEKGEKMTLELVNKKEYLLRLSDKSKERGHRLLHFRYPGEQIEVIISDGEAREAIESALKTGDIEKVR